MLPGQHLQLTIAGFRQHLQARLSHSQLQARQNRIGFHPQNAVHLAGHGKTAVIAGTHEASGAVGQLSSIDQDVIGDPAVLGKTPFFHDLQSGDRVHDGISALFPGDDLVDHTVPFLPVHHQGFRARERCVKVEGNLADGRIFVRISD